MPPRLDKDSDTVRTQIVSTKKFIDRVDDWRRSQKHIPSKSEAIRELVERGLDRENKDPLLPFEEWRRVAEQVGIDGVDTFVRDAIEKALKEREVDHDALLNRP